MQNKIEKTPEQRIKRLEVAVIALSVAFFASLLISFLAYMQILTFSSKIPDYKEIKEDIKTLKGAYDVAKDKAPVVKEAVVNSYEYTKEKAGDLVDYFKGDKDGK
jgi:hypothetical protein